MSDWFKPMPIYVTRPGADGVRGSMSLAIIWAMLVFMLIFLNVVGWATYSLYLLGDKVI